MFNAFFVRFSTQTGVVLSLGLHLGVLILFIGGVLFFKNAPVSLSDGETSYVKATLVGADTLNLPPIIKPQATKPTPPAVAKPKPKPKPTINQGEKEVQTKRGGNTTQKANTSDADAVLKTGRKENTTKAKPEAEPSKDALESIINEKEAKAEQRAQQTNIVRPYYRQINAVLVENWTRPAHIEPGEPYESVFEMTLNVDGTLDSVTLVESSGDNLFDRSALAAISKIERFVVPKDPELFEPYFAHITLSFTNPD